MSDVTFDAIKEYFDKKFSAYDAKVSARNPKPVVLQRKGNQDQLDHSNEVLLAVRTAIENIESNDTESALVQLKTACKSVEKRVKLIRLADKSEHGWNTVYEYLSDDLASDSDDQKRIKRAENEAGKKRKRRQADFLSKKRNVTNPSSGPSSSSAEPNRSQFFRSSAPFRKQFKFEDKCFKCGKAGHWRSSCTAGTPYTPSSSNQ